MLIPQLAFKLPFCNQINLLCVSLVRALLQLIIWPRPLCRLPRFSLLARVGFYRFVAIVFGRRRDLKSGQIAELWEVKMKRRIFRGFHFWFVTVFLKLLLFKFYRYIFKYFSTHSSINSNLSILPLLKFSTILFFSLFPLRVHFDAVLMTLESSK